MRKISREQLLTAAAVLGLPDPHHIRQIIIEPEKVTVYRYMLDKKKRSESRLSVPGYRGSAIELLEYEVE